MLYVHIDHRALKEQLWVHKMLLNREVLFCIHTFFFVRCFLQIFLLMIFRLTFPCISYSLSMAEKHLILRTRCKLDLFGLLEFSERQTFTSLFPYYFSKKKRANFVHFKIFSLKLPCAKICWKYLSVVRKGTYTCICEKP